MELNTPEPNLTSNPMPTFNPNYTSGARVLASALSNCGADACPNGHADAYSHAGADGNSPGPLPHLLRLSRRRPIRNLFRHL